LELGFTQKKVIPLPSAVNLKIQDRYNFSFTSLNSFELRVLSNNIRSLRKPNSYTGKGILLNNENIILKQGKKTQY
jgi:ribosomal protein L6P/L9E